MKKQKSGSSTSSRNIRAGKLNRGSNKTISTVKSTHIKLRNKFSELISEIQDMLSQAIIHEQKGERYVGWDTHIFLFWKELLKIGSEKEILKLLDNWSAVTDTENLNQVVLDDMVHSKIIEFRDRMKRVEKASVEELMSYIKNNIAGDNMYGYEDYTDSTADVLAISRLEKLGLTKKPREDVIQFVLDLANNTNLVYFDGLGHNAINAIESSGVEMPDSIKQKYLKKIMATIKHLTGENVTQMYQIDEEDMSMLGSYVAVASQLDIIKSKTGKKLLEDMLSALTGDDDVSEYDERIYRNTLSSLLKGNVSDIQLVTEKLLSSYETTSGVARETIAEAIKSGQQPHAIIKALQREIRELAEYESQELGLLQHFANTELKRLPELKKELEGSINKKRNIIKRKLDEDEYEEFEEEFEYAAEYGEIDYS